MKHVNSENELFNFGRGKHHIINNWLFKIEEQTEAF
jgi:hypothetical protein